MRTLVKLPVRADVYDYIAKLITERGASDLVGPNYINMEDIALVKEVVTHRIPNPRCKACNGTGYLRSVEVLGPALIACGCLDTGRRDDEA